ncbi:unnamed protein product [Meganyctiphanes norvegica]|uniref:Uncharacterized protein n=1 Tax=Meganyctiphanes norvegica TaxID=48144 RepID=A0AAV2SD99_MEGNR
MINLMFQTLAVPYGYTTECSNMEDNNIEWHQLVCSNNHRNGTSAIHGPMLPDLILDTPPPSPLRRAHSYHFIFPEKSYQTDLPPTPTSSLLPSQYSLPPPTPTSLPPTPSTAGDEDHSVPTMSVERIQAVRRQILADPEARVPPLHHLPQLTWDVPLPSHVRSPQPLLQIPQQQTEEQRTCRTVGDDLRRIADKFHLDHAMVRRKRSHNSRNGMDIVIPIALTRCLQVSLVAIACWRLLNKFG